MTQDSEEVRPSRTPVGRSLGFERSLLGVLALVFGVVFPNRRFSPVQRRMVDILEAVLIALVLPLALGVMDLYMYIRDLNISL